MGQAAPVASKKVAFATIPLARNRVGGAWPGASFTGTLEVSGLGGAPGGIASAWPTPAAWALSARISSGVSCSVS